MTVGQYCGRLRQPAAETRGIQLSTKTRAGFLEHAPNQCSHPVAPAERPGAARARRSARSSLRWRLLLARSSVVSNNAAYPGGCRRGATPVGHAYGMDMGRANVGAMPGVL